MLFIRPQLRASTLFRPAISHTRPPKLSRSLPARFVTTAGTQKRSLRPYVYGTGFIILGAFIGTTLTYVIRPLPFPVAGSNIDAQLLGQLASEIDNLPLIKSLRRSANVAAGGVQESLHKDTAISVENGDSFTGSNDEQEWIELSVDFERSNTMLNGMLGFGKMGVQRAFWQPETKEVVMVLWYGGLLAGWPGIAHGGCTATFCIEGMGKAVNCVRQLGGGINGYASTTPPDPSSLSLTYLRPIKANSIYIMRAQMADQDRVVETSLPPTKDLTKKQHDERSSITHQLNKKYEVNGTIEDMEGKVCVKASAVWDIM